VSLITVESLLAPSNFLLDKKKNAKPFRLGRLSFYFVYNIVLI